MQSILKYLNKFSARVRILMWGYSRDIYIISFSLRRTGQPDSPQICWRGVNKCGFFLMEAVPKKVPACINRAMPGTTNLFDQLPYKLADTKFGQKSNCCQVKRLPKQNATLINNQSHKQEGRSCLCPSLQTSLGKWDFICTWWSWIHVNWSSLRC